MWNGKLVRCLAYTLSTGLVSRFSLSRTRYVEWQIDLVSSLYSSISLLIWFRQSVPLLGYFLISLNWEI